MGLRYGWLNTRRTSFTCRVEIKSSVLGRGIKVSLVNHGGSETHVKSTDRVGIMAGQTVAFPDVSRLGRFPYAGRQLFEADQLLREESTATTTLLIDDPPQEHSDEGSASFERIVEVRAALLES